MADMVRVHIRLPKEQYRQLLDESQKIGNPISSIVRVAINNYLLEKGKEKGI